MGVVTGSAEGQNFALSCSTDDELGRIVRAYESKPEQVRNLDLGRERDSWDCILVQLCRE